MLATPTNLIPSSVAGIGEVGVTGGAKLFEAGYAGRVVHGGIGSIQSKPDDMNDTQATFFHPRHISQKLMRVVFAIYLAITAVITSAQFITEYKTTQNDVMEELAVLEQTFHNALTTGMWQMNRAQLDALTQGLMSMPIIAGLDIVDSDGNALYSIRKFQPDHQPLSLFAIEKPLTWTLNNKTIALGVLKLYSSSDVVADRVLLGFILIAVSAVVKTVVLWLLFLWAFRRFLGDPLQQLTENINAVDLEHIGDKKVEIGVHDNNEFECLQVQFNHMLDRIKQDREALLQEEKNRRQWLEQEVAARTQELQAANEQLSNLAATDSLTGILNRRVFFEQAQFQMDLSLRKSTPLCMLVMDIDNFKTINDSYGHGAGDTVLSCFADVVQSSLRKTDVFGRVGGEEFAILLINTELDAAVALAEKLRESVQETLVQHEGQCIRMSVSIGVAMNSADDTLAKELFSRSDEFLYKAKHNGRNRVEQQACR